MNTADFFRSRLDAMIDVIQQNGIRRRIRCANVHDEKIVGGQNARKGASASPSLYGGTQWLCAKRRAGNGRKKESCEFLYVASGEPHKNHRRMIEAWRLLAEEGLFTSLRLTLDETRFSTLCREIEEMCQRHGLKVKNMGTLSHGDVLALYKDVDALIYPSTFESFGLPLIEARQEGLPVIAAELDYVRDVCSPVQTFDPTSPVSIARAVKRFLAVPEPALQLRSPQEFWRELLGATSE